MDTKDKAIYIVGAGISGLIAATVLEKQGYSPIFFEKTEGPGGRVKTSFKDDFQLDHGFQVLLEAYPKAKQYLDYDALSLRKFLPGAVVFKKGKKETIGDASRNLSLALPTIFSGIGNFSDKLKVLKLNSELKRKSIEAIFESKEQTTLSYLKRKGFSDEIINDFFKPFFSGIFLETELDTSSRMFEFVYKMFGEGMAVIPEKGIGAITEQLTAKLKNTQFNYNTAVDAITDDKIILSDGSQLKFDALILTAESSGLPGRQPEKKVSWKSCDNLYFKTKNEVIKKPVIGLIADKDALINNIYYPSVFNEKNEMSPYVSVTVVKDHQLSSNELEKKVADELKTFCKIEVSGLIAHYAIKRALPDLTDLSYDIEPEKTQLAKGVFQAGDILLNGSLNAAMISGERAAQAAIMYLEKS